MIDFTFSLINSVKTLLRLEMSFNTMKRSLQISSRMQKINSEYLKVFRCYNIGNINHDDDKRKKNQ